MQGWRECPQNFQSRPLSICPNPAQGWNNGFFSPPDGEMAGARFQL